MPMRLMMKGYSFTPAYWKSVHCALVDLVRQIGYPKMFWTIAPYEWSFPYHCWIRDAMDKLLRRRLFLPIAESLHMVHVMLQTVRGLLTGKGAGTWDRHLLHAKRADGSRVELSYFIRIEFQDGARKAATQDYHGSGRPHAHVQGGDSKGSCRTQTCPRHQVQQQILKINQQ